MCFGFVHFEEEEEPGTAAGPGDCGCKDVRRTMGVSPVESESWSSRPEDKCRLMPMPRAVIFFLQFRRRGVVGGVGGDNSRVVSVHAATDGDGFLLILLLIEAERRTVAIPVPVRRVRLKAMGRLKSST